MADNNSRVETDGLLSSEGRDVVTDNILHHKYNWTEGDPVTDPLGMVSYIPVAGASVQYWIFPDAGTGADSITMLADPSAHGNTCRRMDGESAGAEELKFKYSDAHPKLRQSLVHHWGHMGSVERNIQANTISFIGGSLFGGHGGTVIEPNNYDPWRGPFLHKDIGLKVFHKALTSHPGWIKPPQSVDNINQLDGGSSISSDAPFEVVDVTVGALQGQSRHFIVPLKLNETILDEQNTKMSLYFLNSFSTTQASRLRSFSISFWKRNEDDTRSLLQKTTIPSSATVPSTLVQTRNGVTIPLTTRKVGMAQVEVDISDMMANLANERRDNVYFEIDGGGINYFEFTYVGAIYGQGLKYVNMARPGALASDLITLGNDDYQVTGTSQSEFAFTSLSQLTFVGFGLEDAQAIATNVYTIDEFSAAYQNYIKILIGHTAQQDETVMTLNRAARNVVLCTIPITEEEISSWGATQKLEHKKALLINTVIREAGRQWTFPVVDLSSSTLTDLSITDLVLDPNEIEQGVSTSCAIAAVLPARSESVTTAELNLELYSQLKGIVITDDSSSTSGNSTRVINSRDIITTEYTTSPELVVGTWIKPNVIYIFQNSSTHVGYLTSPDLPMLTHSWPSLIDKDPRSLVRNLSNTEYTVVFDEKPRQLKETHTVIYDVTAAGNPAGTNGNHSVLKLVDHVSKTYLQEPANWPGIWQLKPGKYLLIIETGSLNARIMIEPFEIKEDKILNMGSLVLLTGAIQALDLIHPNFRCTFTRPRPDIYGVSLDFIDTFTYTSSHSGQYIRGYGQYISDASDLIWPQASRVNQLILITESYE